MLTSIILILVIVLLVLTWYRFSQVKEKAVQAAKEFCQAQHMELLDDTVMLKRVKLARNDTGRLCLERIYRLTYFNPQKDRRAQTWLHMLGDELKLISLAREGNVIHLSDYDKE